MDDTNSARPVVILGAAGQLGEAMASSFATVWRTIPVTRSDLDLTNHEDLGRVMRDLRPWAVVNCAGDNHVDDAEVQPMRALAVNAFAVRSLAAVAHEVDAVLVQYSSDFVFDGEADAPYREDDRPNPRSVYAASKLVGEWFAAEVRLHYVLRVESLFGGVTRRKSSLDRILDALVEGRGVRVFTDRVVSPSYVWDVVAATKALLQTLPAAGLYHCVNTGAATWHDVALEVQRQLGSSETIEPITMKDITLAAPRPRYCALSNAKLRGVGIEMPSWQNAIARAITERVSSRPPKGTH